MAEIDANIAVMRKKIAAQKALILGITPEATLRDIANEKPKASPNGMSLDDEKMCIFKRKAQAIVFAAQQRMEPEPPVDFVASVDNGLARLINRDRAKARKAVDDLRHLCHDPEKGLDCIEKAADSMILPVSDETLQSVRDFVSKKKLEDSQRRRMLRKEYRYLEETWKKRLKSARDKRSKEKREANRDRDRYLLVQTRGPAGLLTCKTSSGRTSHKIMPVTPGGVMNNVAEVDSILADIEQAGGTPGSHHIWMKTLAQIPDQDPSKVPYDSGMLLIDDPIAEVYAARCVNPWTREEKLIFLEKYLLYQKNFHKIAGFLDYKDTGDCVRFYFDHKLKYNLKQLLRESGSMKRKGIRTQHLLMLAGLPSTRQALTRGIVDPHRAEGDRALESGTGVIDAAASPYEPTTAPETPNNDTDPGVGPMLDPEPGSVEHHANGLAPMNSVVFKLESEQIDLSAAERAVFSNALVKYGKNWKVIADEHGFFGGNVGQLITYFNRNKERYNFVSSIEKHALAEGVAREDAAAKSERGNAERDSLKFRIHEKGSPDQRSRTERPHPRPHASPRRSSDGADEPRKATWTQDEMATVEQHFRDYGKDWKKISKLMGQKTPQQVKGYWKKQNPQERDSSGSKKKRHRVKSNQSSPLLVKSGSMRNGIPASAKEEKTELAREHSRKRDADDAKLADQRSRGEKRERLGNDAESPRGARKEVVDGGTPVPRKLASPKSPKVAEPSGSPRLPMRFPLRSKPAPEVGSVKPASKASVDEGKECAGSPS